MVGMKPPMIRHVKVLCLEFKKATPNKHTVAELMKLTFTVRRQRILTVPVSMEFLLKTHPPFRQYNQVCDLVNPYLNLDTFSVISIGA